MRPPKFLRHFFGWWRIFLVLGLLLPTASPLNAVARPLEIPTRKPADQTRFESVMELGRWRILYGLKTGEADIYCDGKLLIAHAVAVVKLSEPVTSRNYNTHEIFHRQIQDQFGRGMEFKVESANGTAEKMIQTFWLYEDVDYFLTEVKVSRPAGASSNFMSPLTSQTPTSFLPNGANRVLNVPFDNDKWVRYNAVPFGSNITSSEVSAFYNPASRQGLVVGSIEHGTWKTGIKSTTTSNIVNSLEIFGGLASSQTRDELPHGKISGENIKSPKIFVGLFSDWRDGLETFAHANALIAPPRPWTNGVPFGWNSWGKLQWKISPVTAREVSDFFAAELQPRGFQNDGTVYIGLDSGWNKFSDAELSEFVAHCRSNHQAAGIYFTPFAAFGDRGSNAPVASTDYKYKDLYLYANGRTQRLDGGIALDPTHPGTKHLIETTVARFKQAGFKYIKADFLTHGALEADQHFDPRVTTGLQAYNAGMKFIADTIGSEMYLNESIAPLFPAQYANSRRIACDTFGRIDETEYALNSLTYGWWLSGVYDFNDADHVVLARQSDGENRARVTASVLTGIFISGDDFSNEGDPEAKLRAQKYLTNADINAVAKIKKSFRPVEGDTGDRAAKMFSFEDAEFFYLAAFNFTKTDAAFTVDLPRLGLINAKPVWVKELWSGETNRVARSITIRLNPVDAALYKFFKNGKVPAEH